MKKQIKFAAVLSAAAVLTAAAPLLGNDWFPGASVEAAQKSGWINEDGQWRYKDSDDYYLTDSWKKRDGDWYYLNQEGYVTTNSRVDEYYVNEEGKRVIRQWLTIENEEDWDSDSLDEYRYYFGKDGKSIVSKWETIEEKTYYFNEDGQMQVGMIEVDGDIYYLGDENDGVRKTGWIKMENEDMDLDLDYVWHYFDNKGRMVRDEVDYKISGNYYTFEEGIMQTGWYKLPAAEAAETATASDAAIAEEVTTAALYNYRYYETDGKRASGWYEIEGAPGISEEGEIYSFYFKNGVPTFAATGIQMFSINSKRYAFNTKGEMQTGLQTITLEDGTTARAYFGDDGVMKTGKQTIYDEELEQKQIWFFSTEGTRRGLGVQGIQDNVIYFDGLRQEAFSDLRYAPVELNGVRYLVNNSGTIQKASSGSKSQTSPELGKGFKDIKDANDNLWTVNVDGIIQ